MCLPRVFAVKCCLTPVMAKIVELDAFCWIKKINFGRGFAPDRPGLAYTALPDLVGGQGASCPPPPSRSQKPHPPRPFGPRALWVSPLRASSLLTTFRRPCVRCTGELCKTGEPIEMPFGGRLTYAQRICRRVKAGRIHWPPRRVTTRRCGLSSKFVDHLFTF